jgi:hypothetical protein
MGGWAGFCLSSYIYIYYDGAHRYCHYIVQGAGNPKKYVATITPYIDVCVSEYVSPILRSRTVRERERERERENE